jgi:tRNA (guanine26-N2/guanine27-N2)-dimethyltransferase
MLNLAVEWGWAYTSENGIILQKLLDTMIEESVPRLPPGYIRHDEVCLAVTYLFITIMYWC